MSFDPISLMFMTVAGIGAAGSIMQGRAASRQANYDAQIALFNSKAAEQNAGVSLDNAKYAEENAVEAIQRAQLDQVTLDNEAAALKGSQLATQGASGLSIGGRTQILTRNASEQIARQDAYNARMSGEYAAQDFRTEARGFRQEAQNYYNDAAVGRASAKAAKQRGKNARLSSYFDAAGTLIGAAKPSGSSLYTSSVNSGSSGYFGRRNYGYLGTSRSYGGPK